MILLSRPYAGYATVSAGPVTPGAATTSLTSGRGAFGAGASSVVITNPNVTAESKIWAVLNQAAADGTLLYIARIVPAAGSFTVYGNTTATAAIAFDWCILMPSGELPTA